MSKVYILCGLPGSGKSTWARWKVSQEPNTIIINRDALRTMIKDKYVYDPELEHIIKESSSVIIDIALSRGYDVILDETNLTADNRNRWCGFDRVCVWCIEEEKCLENRMKHARGYTEEKWKEVIEGMQKAFEVPNLEAEGFSGMITVSPKDIDFIIRGLI